MTRLLLLGGGHAHLQVLKAISEQPLVGAEATLISPSRTQFYSGMLPGFVGGDYTHDQAAIDLQALCDRASIRFVQTAATAIHAEAGTVETEAGEMGFDLLSLDVGSVPAGRRLPGVEEFAIPIRPFENARRIIDRVDAPGGEAARSIVIVGGGAGGVEIALAVRRRAGPAPTIRLIDAEAPLSSWPSRGQRIIRRVLAERAIDFEQGEIGEVLHASVRFSDGRSAAADLVIWATGPAPHPIIASSTGLAISHRGLIEVDMNLEMTAASTGATLRKFWAAGDCADIVGQEVPRAGVFAVRQGPVLAGNLRAAIEGKEGEEYRPQRRYLSILNTADGRGLARWGPLTWRGRWLWLLKDWIDRRWIARFR